MIGWHKASFVFYRADSNPQFVSLSSRPIVVRNTEQNQILRLLSLGVRRA
jgi:hypothetical protein